MADGSWEDASHAALERAGYRGGGARRAVISFLSRQTCCVSAQEIFDALRAEGNRVGIASVYRVLDQLAGLKLVQRVDLGSGTRRYEPARAGGEHHHHHVVCDDCGRVEPFSDEPLEVALERLGSDVGYEIGAHDVVLRGSCSACQAP